MEYSKIYIFEILKTDVLKLLNQRKSQKDFLSPENLHFRGFPEIGKEI